MAPDGQVITKREPKGRFSVSSHGELTIRELVWKDMGVYTCYLENKEGDDSVQTFVYPLVSELKFCYRSKTNQDHINCRHASNVGNFPGGRNPEESSHTIPRGSWQLTIIVK